MAFKPQKHPSRADRKFLRCFGELSRVTLEERLISQSNLPLFNF